MSTDTKRQLDLSGYDRLLEHRSRFVICALLANEADINFRELKQLLKESDGNLGAQLRKLDVAGYIKVKRSFQHRRPVSSYSLTRKGNAALSRHVSTIHRLTEDFHHETQ
ncbi:MAG: transcriptional regulator [Pseudomonadales bacterium]